MQGMRRTWVSVLFWTALSLGIGFGALQIRSAADGPNRTVSWTRVYTSALPPKRLTEALTAVASNWPNWHFHTVQAQVVDGDDHPLPLNFQFIETGSRVVLTQEVKGRKSKRYGLLLRVVEYLPGKSLRLALERDTKGQISALVEDLEWKIDLAPEGAGTRITAQIWGTTRSARARALAFLAEGVLMNQLWLADIEALSKIEQPVPVIAIPHGQR